jgi:subtilisin family serine protease
MKCRQETNPFDNIRCFIILFTVIVLFAPFTEAAGDDYIIVYKDHAKKQKMLKRPEFAKARSFDIIPAMAAQLDANQIEQLRQDPDVAYIEPDYKVYAMGGPSTTAEVSSAGVETLASSQTIPYGITMVNAPAVWPKTKGAGVKVAVLDTGISMYHPDRGNVVASISFVSGEAVEDFDGHGTHTSGTIAAADNGIGVVGVAPEAELLIAKVLDNTGSGNTSDIISGIQWAVNNNAKVISMSLGSTSYSAAFDTACQNAFNAGVLVVAAAGNSSSSTPSYPAGFSSVMAISAIDSSKTFASSFSNYGSDISLAAPGVSVYSTVCPVDSTNSTGATANAVWSSTSHQANVVTGTAAGSVSGQICDCGLATGTSPDVCPPTVSGNIAYIQRGTNTFAEKVAYARSKGAIGVIISNNSNGNFNGTLGDGSPLIVASISKSDGTALHSLIPSGINGTVTVNATLYQYYSGTSMACPHVAGVAALIFAASGTNTSPAEVQTILENSAQDLGVTGWDQYYGYGLVNASAAINLVVPHNCSAGWVLGTGLAADIDHDCFVSFDDLQTLLAQWLTSGCSSTNNWCNGSDIVQSGSVNLADFSKLAADWLACNDPQHINCN